MCKYLMLAADVLQAGRLEDDPIAVVDDSHVFGRHEDIRVWEAEMGTTEGFPGLFYVLEIPGMDRLIGERILEPWQRPALPGEPNYGADPIDAYTYLGPNRWQLGKQDRLPPPVANQIKRDGFYIMTYDVDTINNYVIDRTGLDVFITDTPINP